jgi:hypothetical protein
MTLTLRGAEHVCSGIGRVVLQVSEMACVPQSVSMFSGELENAYF